MSFEKAFAFSIKWEGGDKITDDPDDPGGLTRFGISKRAHPDVDIRNLTEQQAKAIYLASYYEKAGCDQLPEPLDMVHFDAAVNAGVSRAEGWLHEALNANPDHPAVPYMQAREAYYAKLAHQKPTMQKYLVGWIRRCTDLRKAAGVL